MGEVKRLRQENLRLKDQIQALCKEVEQMKLLLQQSSIQLAGEPPTTANSNATPSREGEKYRVRGVSLIKFTYFDSCLVFFDFDILSLIKEKIFLILIFQLIFDFQNLTSLISQLYV